MAFPVFIGMQRTFLVLGFITTAVRGVAADTAVIATMDELRWNVPKEKGRTELVEGKVGKAVKFTFENESKSALFTSNIRGAPEWDQAAGFSFWVRGDGSNNWGGLQFIYNEDYALRYDYAFPIRGSEWRKITVAWSDLIPVLPRPNANPLDPAGENRPSKLSGPWFGKWWYWSDYPAHSFAVDEIRLEPTITRDTQSYLPPGAPLERCWRSSRPANR
jgi:hypothetical protein